MLAVAKQVILLSICSIITLNSAVNIQEAEENKLEDNTDTTRNARYVRYQSNPESQYYSTGGYFYPNRDYYYPNTNLYPGGGSTQFYPVDRYPNKLDPNYWINKIPGISNSPGNYYPNYYPSQSYPGQQNPHYYPQGGTNVIGYNPYPSRYPSRYPQSGYPQVGYPQVGYPQVGYPAHGNGGYGGYQGNGGFTSYSGYDGYYSAGNRPGNIGFGYQNSRTNGVIGPINRFPNTLMPIATPSTVSKDAK